MKRFYVEYNCKFIAMYKSVRACLNFINRKNLYSDDLNLCRIFDNEGNEYDIYTGQNIL